MASGLSPAYFDWLDEVARAPNGVLVQERGETRVRPVSLAFAEWRARNRQAQKRTCGTAWRAAAERRRHQLAIQAHLIEKDERE